MQVGYHYLQSIVHEGSSTHREKAKAYFQELRSLTGAEFHEQAAGELSLVYVATGGTAGLFRELLPRLCEPVYLLSVGSDNSLSASMEMLSYLQQQGMTGEIIHGTPPSAAQNLAPLLQAARAKSALRGMRVGMVGAPSDWLISAVCDYSFLESKLGIQVVDVPIEELQDEIALGGYPEGTETADLLAHAFDRMELEKALNVYGALCRIVQRYNLQGLSVRCFDLLGTVCSTSCLALSILNSRGIYAGCEGDLPSLISMMILGEISRQPVFQCNPSRVDEAAGSIVLAHCTLPLNMPVRYTLDTHFESGIGVAVAGDVPLGHATLFKASGDLARYQAADCEIEEDLHESDLCRTQIRLQCGQPTVDRLLRHPIGNHYLVANGYHSGSVDAFFQLLL